MRLRERNETAKGVVAMSLEKQQARDASAKTHSRFLAFLLLHNMNHHQEGGIKTSVISLAPSAEVVANDLTLKIPLNSI